jgi:hypothetical protein
VGNQLGDLGNTTCTEKNKNIGAARPNEDAARRTFTAPRGMVEWQREAESTEFREAGLFPNTPLFDSMTKNSSFLRLWPFL